MDPHFPSGESLPWDELFDSCAFDFPEIQPEATVAFDNGTGNNYGGSIANSSNLTNNFYDPLALSHPVHGNAFHAATTDLFADSAQSRAITADIKELEQRLEKIEQNILYTLEKTDSIYRAMRKWSEVVNKSLLEIAKAVGIPLQYRDGAVGLQPTFGPGATMEFTVAEVDGREGEQV
ncbi:hypothetical protein B0H67DRAFT_687857 [Lasiosphaeris hirsuta]|uniref:Uncharacterized protein n=1 Tax=Lasiosphaeris hirsuta TaxID=260670 RepID=A0AA39ZS93_9PEZI|nr:hypothetical protein B0H67DRAFT_687857 [Lasiosphaeris hirsuta]